MKLSSASPSFLLLSVCAGVALAMVLVPARSSPTDPGDGDSGPSAPTYFEQGVPLRAGEIIQPLGPGLMGDVVNEYSGDLQFTQTDVSLPGNNGLAVAIGRRIAMGARRAGVGLFGDWDLEIPHLYTVAMGDHPSWYGGTAASHNDQRCSQFAAPPYSTYQVDFKSFYRLVDLQPDGWWGGYHLYVPGAGDMTLLKRRSGSQMNSVQPTDGRSYPVLTKQHWQLSCLNSLGRGTGEGFEAVSPDGTRYRFDHLIVRDYPSYPLPNNGPKPRVEIWILPTVITDRFGNWVRYTYQGGDGSQVASITSSDGRAISLTYNGNGNRVGSVSDGTRTWTYGYNNTGNLNNVTLPDQSSWSLDLVDLERDRFTIDSSCTSGAGGNWDYSTRRGTVVHPSGASATFDLRLTVHGRTNVPGNELGCEGIIQVNGVTYVNTVPLFSANYAIVNKTISGPGLSPISWTYGYSEPVASFNTCDVCFTPSKTVTLTDSDGRIARNTYGTRFGEDEGLLLRAEEGDANGFLRDTSFAYRLPSDGPYPPIIGLVTSASDSMSGVYTPQSHRAISQQGVVFTSDVTSFDRYARPISFVESNSLGFRRDATTAYFDQTDLWAIGQVASRVVSGIEASRTVFDGRALPSATYRFGKLHSSYAFAQDGTLSTLTDGAGHRTTYTDYMRGLPRSIAYHDGTSLGASVSNIGSITSTTNEVHATWSYGYDAMGRIALKQPPADAGVAYNPTVLTFERVPYDEYDIAGGHWRQTIVTGSAVTVNILDARWRKRIATTYDANSPATTQSMQRFDYDAFNRITYASYPARSVGSIAEPRTPGSTTVYDALGRPTFLYTDSELGMLATSTQYLADFKTRVTNPRQFTTVTSYQVFAEPGENAPVSIRGPEGYAVDIDRDVFGKAQRITRRGDGGFGAPASFTRSYVYDQFQQLCKTIEPEVGATVQDYDGAGNVAWRATGLALTDGGQCNRADVH